MTLEFVGSRISLNEGDASLGAGLVWQFLVELLACIGTQVRSLIWRIDGFGRAASFNIMAYGLSRLDLSEFSRKALDLDFKLHVLSLC